MKAKLLIMILGITALLFTSCEDFLDKNPRDAISSQTFWNTEMDAEMGLAGVYSTLLNQSAYDHQRANFDCMTEIGYQYANHYETANIARGLIEPTLGGYISSIYSQSYKGIAVCNSFLDNIDNVDMDPAKITRYKSEVMFLRALFYFTLTEFYGGVPLPTKPVTIEEAKVAQSTKAEVVAQVLQDLDNAISGLPDAAYTDGHAVKGSALALKAKVLMHNENWSQAAAAASQVIQSGIFSLYTGNYQEMFLTVGQDNNPEIIFSAKYLNPDRNATWGPDIINGWWNSPSIQPDFPDYYECIDGLPIDQSPLYTGDPSDKTNRDPRFDYTVRYKDEPIVRSDGYEWSDWTAGAKGDAPMLKKYVNPESVPIDYSTLSDQDYIFIRYADVLLTYAESQNEASGPDQSVYDAVNAIRLRIGMPELPVGLDQAGMRDRIRHERMIELAGEGYRYWDLKRWKTAETIIPQIVDPGGVQRSFDPSKHYLFPFPQSEIDINENLVQNPNY